MDVNEVKNLLNLRDKINSEINKVNNAKSFGTVRNNPFGDVTSKEVYYQFDGLTSWGIRLNKELKKVAKQILLEELEKVENSLKELGITFDSKKVN